MTEYKKYLSALTRYCLLFLLSVWTISSFSQPHKNIREFDSAFYAGKIDSLKKVFGYNKTLIPEHELSVLIALSYFPELDSTPIVFKRKKIKTTLNTRPSFWSLIFRKRANRKYIIRINSKTKDSLVLFDAVPFNAKIGLLGHEFSHIIDYSKKGSFGVAGRGWSYRNSRQKELFEKEIDSITISRGLGWQLYDWSEYVLNKSDARQSYKSFKKNIYLEPEEIKEILQR